MRPEQFLDRLHRLLADGNEVVITSHAQERMHERGVIRAQILDCLEWGEAHEPPQYDTNTGNWTMRLIYHPNGCIPLIVVAAIESPPDEDIVVITVFYL